MDREDLSGKNYVVTGANSGIGFIAARRFRPSWVQMSHYCAAERAER